MLKKLQGIVVIMMLLSASNAGATKADYWVEAKNVIEVSTGVEEVSFQVSVKSWDMNSLLGGISVRAEFQEEVVKETLTNDEGLGFFLIPSSNKEGGKNITISLPNFPEVKKRVVTVVYTHHLKYFGPAFTGVEGVGEKGNYFSETASFSNLVFIQSKQGGVQADINKILSAAQYKMWSFISIDHIFFVDILDDDGVRLDVKLRPDYLERWRKYADGIKSVTSSILGFFVLDEPYWTAIQCGKSFKEMRLMLEEVAFQIKRRFPTKKIGGSICITERELEKGEAYGYSLPEDAKEEYGIPVGYDWVAIYYYWASFRGEYPNGNFSQFAEIWVERLQSFDKHLYQGQKLVLTPGTFSFKGLEVENDLISFAPLYYNLAKSNPKFVAITPFLWPSHENIIGLEEMPSLWQVWQEYGREIISQQ